jgi:hypothetical protein
MRRETVRRQNVPLEDLPHVFIVRLMSEDRLVNSHRPANSKTLADSHVYQIRSKFI